jgi:hypothetical protein
MKTRGVFAPRRGNDENPQGFRPRQGHPASRSDYVPRNREGQPPSLVCSLPASSRRPLITRIHNPRSQRTITTRLSRADTENEKGLRKTGIAFLPKLR